MQLFQRDFNLQWDQLNDLFNHLTDDSNVELNFDRFRDFIKCLWHNKLHNEIENVPVHVLQHEYDYICRNIKEASSSTSYIDFKTSMQRKDDEVTDKTDWELDEDLIERLYSKIELFRANSRSVDEILHSLQIIERTQKTERCLSSSAQDHRLLSVSHHEKENDFEKIKEKQISSLKKLLNFCSNIKNCENSEAVTKILFEIMKFGENSHQRLDDIGKVIATKDDFINFLSAEMDDYKVEAQKSASQFEDFINEISNSKMIIGWIIRSTHGQNQHTNQGRRGTQKRNQNY